MLRFRVELSPGPGEKRFAADQQQKHLPNARGAIMAVGNFPKVASDPGIFIQKILRLRSLLLRGSPVVGTPMCNRASVDHNS